MRHSCRRLCAAVLAVMLAAQPLFASDFTVVLLPDTQYYSLRDPATYNAQMQFVLTRPEDDNVRFMIHLGDITHENTLTEWQRASAAHGALDTAGLPYSVIPGNHDYARGHVPSVLTRDTSRYNSFFGPARFQEQTWYGGHMGSTNDNNFSFFEHEGLQFMVVGLEFAPRKDALCWADRLIRQHPDRRVILATHCYQSASGAHQSVCASGYGLAGSNGPVMWEELVRRHSNVHMVVSGHINGARYRQRTGAFGNSVHEILTDYQQEVKNGLPNGRGWLRTMRFVPEADTVFVRPHTVQAGVTRFQEPEYSPDPAAPDHTFQFDYPMTQMLPPAQHLALLDRFYDRTVNSVGAGAQVLPRVTTGASGDFVVTWQDDRDGNGAWQVHARGFDANGCERFADMPVNVESAGQQRDPVVAADSRGNFVVVWEDDRDGNGAYQVMARGFRSNGTQLFPEMTVNTAATGEQRNPAVAMNGNGAFAVVWEDDADANGSFQIRMRRFLPDGRPNGAELTVNSVAAGQQFQPDVGIDSQGNTTVIWQDDQDGNGFFQILARGFTATGAERFHDRTVNSQNAGQQTHPALAMNPVGEFVAAWEDDADGNGSLQIKARAFTAAGGPLGNEVTVNSTASGQQRRPRVSMDAAGGFVVVWEDDADGNNSFQIRGRGFNRGATQRFADVTVNSNASGQQSQPAVAMHPGGKFVAVWSDDLDGNGQYEILARGFTAVGR